MSTNKSVKYKRNWAWDTTLDIEFENGAMISGSGTTNNKGQLIRIQFDLCGMPKSVEMTDIPYLRWLGIYRIHFTTPAVATIL